MQKILEKIGFQAMFDFENALRAVEFGIKKGFSCVELNLSDPIFFPEKYSPTLRGRLKNYLFPILIHAPEGLSLFNLHQKSLNGTIERIYEIIDFAYEIGAKLLTLHMGGTFTFAIGGEKVWAHHILPHQYADTVKQALIKILEYAKDKVPICVENAGGFRYRIVHQLLNELLSSNELWLTWDIGHTNELNGEDRDKENALFTKFINRVKEVHLHDNNGEWDEHNIPGMGNINFNYYFKLLYSVAPYYIIEVRPKERAVESLRVVKEMLS